MTYAALLGEIHREFPDFRVVLKNESTWMWFLSKLVLLVTFGSQNTFMTKYITTVGQRVYVPGDWDYWSDERRMKVLRHERVHMRQAKKYTRPLFFLLYIFCPLPLGLAYCRARFEWEAYEESMRAEVEYNGPKALANERFREFLIRQFTTGAYGWMWPFRKTVERWYDESSKKILGT